MSGSELNSHLILECRLSMGMRGFEIIDRHALVCRTAQTLFWLERSEVREYILVRVTEGKELKVKT